MSDNITWHEGHVSREERNELLGFKNKVVWFTGLSGSGKSTLARELEKRLHEKGVLSYVLDGDNVRHGLNRDLGFSTEDRQENIKRVAEVARLMYDAGVFVIVSFISPFWEDRDFARSLIGDDFVEVFVKCSLEECERRDTKGLYKKARAGEIQNFTGIHQEYEEPENAEIVVESEEKSVIDSIDFIFEALGGEYS